MRMSSDKETVVKISELSVVGDGADGDGNWMASAPNLFKNLSILSSDQIELAKMLLNEGESHLFAHWPEPGIHDEEKQSLFDQVARLNANYPGGLVAYIRNARTLLADSKANKNPFDGFTPSMASSSRTKTRASSSTQAGGDILKSKKFDREDFNKKQLICEMDIDLDELDQAYPGIMARFEVQGWISAMSTDHDVVSPYAVREVFFNMDRVNKFHISSKVGSTKFVLKSSQIAEFLNVLEDGDETYFDNIRSEQFFALVSREDLEGVVCSPGVSFKNPMHANNLTPVAYVVWQIMLSNILPQTGHTTELSYFAVYTLHGILTGRKINLPMLILNHLFRCRNQKRASLPYARMLTALIQESSVRIKSSELYKSLVKTININTFLCRNVLRRDGDVFTYVEPKRRKLDDQVPPPGSTSNVPPSQEDDDPLAYIDELQLPESPREGARATHPEVGHVTLDSLSQQLSDMHWSMQRLHSRQDRLLRNQEFLVRDMSLQFNFDVSKYEFNTPHSSPPQE